MKTTICLLVYWYVTGELHRSRTCMALPRRYRRCALMMAMTTTDGLRLYTTSIDQVHRGMLAESPALGREPGPLHWWYHRGPTAQATVPYKWDHRLVCWFGRRTLPVCGLVCRLEMECSVARRYRRLPVATTCMAGDNDRLINLSALSF